MFDLKALAKDANKTQTEIGDIIGVDQSQVSFMMRGRRAVLPEHIKLLAESLPHMNMAKYYTPDIPAAIMTPAVEDSSENVDYVKKEQYQEIASVEAEEVKETIVITTDEVRSPDFNLKKEVLKGSLEENAKPTQSIIPEHDVKVYSYCDDMSPEIKAGEAVLVRFMPNTARLIPGNMYFVDLPTSGLIRYVFEQPNGDLLLRAANALYPDLIVPRTEVLSISMVVLILKRPSSACSDTKPLTDALERRDKQIDNLIAIIDKKL